MRSQLLGRRGRLALALLLVTQVWSVAATAAPSGEAQASVAAPVAGLDRGDSRGAEARLALLGGAAGPASVAAQGTSIWVTRPSQTTRTLHSVDCPSPTACVAVADFGTIRVGDPTSPDIWTPRVGGSAKTSSAWPARA